jgi:hypothetical protein
MECRGGGLEHAVVAVVCGAVAMCSSCYGQLGRAALQLEVERCYVGAAAV